MMESVADQKAELRRQAAARRHALPASVRAAAAEGLAAQPFPVKFAAGAVISGFMPLGNEIDVQPLMRKLAAQGARLALPVVVGRGKPLLMRAWRFGAPLVPGAYGVREPTADAIAVDPDILLVPLLAFDRCGRRIGYGAGYYDFTLAHWRARKPVVAVGIGFAVQEVPVVPVTPHDERLDLVLTEREVIDLRAS